MDMTEPAAEGPPSPAAAAAADASELEGAGAPGQAVVFEELRKAAAAGGAPADGPAIRAAVGARLGAAGADALLATFPFGGMIKGASMLFACVDSPLHAAPLEDYSYGCAGGDGFLLEHGGELHLLCAPAVSVSLPRGPAGRARRPPPRAATAQSTPGGGARQWTQAVDALTRPISVHWQLVLVRECFL